MWRSQCHGNEYALPLKCPDILLQVYIRALREDIESWESSAWVWEDILAQYKRLENYLGEKKFASFHGTGGPITTSPPMFRDLLGEKFVESTITLDLAQTGVKIKFLSSFAGLVALFFVVNRMAGLQRGESGRWYLQLQHSKR